MVHPACPLNVECKKTMHIMENNRFKVIIVEDVKLELKGTEEIFRHEIPNAEVIGTAMTENEFWELLKVQLPDMVLLDLGLGGSTTIGVEICSSLRKNYPDMKVLIFTGEVLNEKLWVDALNAGADGIILKTGELLTATDVQAVMDGNWWVFCGQVDHSACRQLAHAQQIGAASDLHRQLQGQHGLASPTGGYQRPHGAGHHVGQYVVNRRR